MQRHRHGGEAGAECIGADSMAFPTLAEGMNRIGCSPKHTVEVALHRHAPVLAADAVWRQHLDARRLLVLSAAAEGRVGMSSGAHPRACPLSLFLDASGLRLL